MQTYTVKKGDTLYSISNQFKVLPADIIKLNNLSNTNLRIGQVLQIPTSSTTNSTTTYTVKRGDTIFMGNNE